MNNPIYMQEMMKKFQAFKRSFSGNPQQMIQQMMNSGRISQEQYEKAVKEANEFMKMMK